MKKKTLRFMVCAAVMALALSVTACTDEEPDEAGAVGEELETAGEELQEASEADSPEETTDDLEKISDEPEAESEKYAEEAEEVEEDADRDYETLEDYYNNPTVKSFLDSQYSALAEEGMFTSIEVKGNEFIVNVQFEDASMMADGIGDAIDQMMEMQANTFRSAAADFDAAIGKEGACTVTVRYLDPDGNVLSENSYTAKDADASGADTGTVGDYETLEDYCNDSAVKSALDSQFGALAADGMSATVEVKGNEFIAIVQFEDSSMMVDGISEALDQMMNTQEDTFKSAAAEFDAAIGQDGACTVTVRYLDPDGKVLSENSYTAG